ncbi:hypothetical protein INR49_008275 [Caranx melampygus]|nr:hypothetical protein INR49_008275 [Caranx melampygus]
MECLRGAQGDDENAVNGDHLWMETSCSGELCYLGEDTCLLKTAQKKNKKKKLPVKCFNSVHTTIILRPSLCSTWNRELRNNL